ncbi:hypothetical protein [Corynebacterium guangdongense]|uniref:Putative zinc-finger domain-containing protein n=1 Tax=Corynebacterium guangdongense TaxID=1783348 RepID=A0ABU1ZVV6_9CORY|nr:hypothetical protein [Corynebacterium guangdongense]MDR7329040.1 hypothetical protein [Corynebacterium guangdongense]WJZ17610.1 Anti-sigma-E factor RseA [Corynebacterium guangdongense]
MMMNSAFHAFADDRLGSARYRRARKKRTFTSVEHLSPEAVAAFADGEMAETAAHRARVHLVQCHDCRMQTHRQRGASALLRQHNSSEEVRAPKDLIARLTGIAMGPQADGPGADTVPCAKPEDFLDRVETMLRAFRRLHGR